MEGEKPIISGDINDEVTGENIQEFFEKYEMKECLTELVENPPEMYAKNQNRKTIDGIWITPGLNPIEHNTISTPY